MNDATEKTLFTHVQKTEKMSPDDEKFNIPDQEKSLNRDAEIKICNPEKTSIYDEEKSYISKAEKSFMTLESVYENVPHELSSSIVYFDSSPVYANVEDLSDSLDER